MYVEAGVFGDLVLAKSPFLAGHGEAPPNVQAVGSFFLANHSSHRRSRNVWRSCMSTWVVHENLKQYEAQQNAYLQHPLNSTKRQQHNCTLTAIVKHRISSPFSICPGVSSLMISGCGSNKATGLQVSAGRKPQVWPDDTGSCTCSTPLHDVELLQSV